MSVLFGSSQPSAAARLTKLLREKKIRKIASRIYSEDLETPPQEIVRINLHAIIRHFYPGAIISHRSAVEAKPSATGSFHLTHLGKNKTHELPGVTLRLWQGPPAAEGDTLLGEQLFIASRARALLENLTESRSREGRERKTLDREAFEGWLDRLCRIHGPAELEQMLRQAEALAPVLGLADAAKPARELIGAMINGDIDQVLTTPLASARAAGMPYDPDRVALFTELATRLATEVFPPNPERPAKERTLHAFWESYFSNFIEGTVFTVEEARAIVFDAKVPPTRPKDAHDILSTFRLAVDPGDRGRAPKNPDDFIQLLQLRHARLMHDRLEIGPGRFKETANRVSTREFVSPELVRGTLKQGFIVGRHLPDPVARALYQMFVIAEVHPFNDGNGRLARIFLNAELTAKASGRIIVPTSLRGDYLSCLEALTTGRNPEPFLRLAARLIKFSRDLACGSWEESVAALESSGALKDPPLSSWGLAAAVVSPGS